MNTEFAQVKELLSPAPAVDTAPEAKAEPEVVETPAQDVAEDVETTITDETTQAIADEIKDESEEVTQEEPTDAEPSDAEDIQTIAQLAKAIDVDADYLYKIKIGMGNDQEPISIGDIKDKYQDQLHNNTKLQAQIDEQATQLESAQGGVQQREQISEQGRVLQLESAKLNDQYNEIDWAKFEQESPGEASLAKQKFGEAHNNLMNKAREVEHYESQVSQQVLQQSANQLMEMIPAWKDETVRNTEQRQVADLLTGAGYPHEYVAGLADPIAISLVRELVQLRSEKARATASMSKVNKAPRVLKSRGKFAQKPDANFQKARDKARTTGNREDELNAVKMILAGRS